MQYEWKINYNDTALNFHEFCELEYAVKRVLNLTEIVIKGPDGLGKPWITSNKISFNGNYHGFEHWESFKIQRAWEYCKDTFNCKTGLGKCDTSIQPYDSVVAATLLMFKHYFPTQVKLYPTGINDNWKRGYDLAEQVITPLETLEMLIDA